jgi:hypothetical protein
MKCKYALFLRNQNLGFEIKCEFEALDYRGDTSYSPLFTTFSSLAAGMLKILGVNINWYCKPVKLYCYLTENCRSQSPRGLRFEMSLPIQTLESWVRIQLEIRTSFRVYCVFVMSCTGSGLATGWSPVQGVLPIVYNIVTCFYCTWQQ